MLACESKSGIPVSGFLVEDCRAGLLLRYEAVPGLVISMVKVKVAQNQYVKKRHVRRSKL